MDRQKIAEESPKILTTRQLRLRIFFFFFKPVLKDTHKYITNMSTPMEEEVNIDDVESSSEEISICVKCEVRSTCRDSEKYCAKCLRKEANKTIDNLEKLHAKLKREKKKEAQREQIMKSYLNKMKRKIEYQKNSEKRQDQIIQELKSIGVLNKFL